LNLSPRHGDVTSTTATAHAAIAHPLSATFETAYLASIRRSTLMARSIVIGLAMLAGAALGAAAVNELGAQGRPPGAFAVIDISDVTDPEVFSRQLLIYWKWLVFGFCVV
jgi:hypothetical protein